MLNSFIYRVFFRLAYWYISTIDKKGSVTFMNYGYHENGKDLILNPEDETNRYAIQLYHQLVEGINISGKDILEIGSGRGGGLNYICKNLNPRSATGVDLNEKAISFCNKNYADPRIKFIHANAEDLLLGDSIYDVVINIESSHGYPNMEGFVSEAYRVLKPGGYFLLADFRPKSGLPTLKKILSGSKFSIPKEKLITAQVLESLDRIHLQRENQIREIVPSLFRGMSRNFAGLKGTRIFTNFVNREYEYGIWTMQKPGIEISKAARTPP